MIVVGVIDRRYGKKFTNWDPYPEYAGLSPTHAELRHAVKTGKRFLLYVRDQVQNYYDLYRENRDAFDGLHLPEGLDTDSLEMYREFKLLEPGLWIASFRDIRDVKSSLQQRLLNDLYQAMLQREVTTNATVETLTNAFVKSDPALRDAVIKAADPQVRKQIEVFDGQLAELQTRRAELEATKDRTAQEVTVVQEQMKTLEENRARLNSLLQIAFGRALAGALAGGLPLIAIHRTTGPDSLPTLSDQDVARSGLHFSGFSQATPVIKRVTWARVPRRATDGTWRGYDACLQIFGQNFAPGCKIQVRHRDDPTTENNFGWTPNVYSGHYLELSTNTSDESPIGDLVCDYRVANPLRSSDWVPFSYDYDPAAEIARAEALLAEGEKAFGDKRYQEAIEPLRSAHVRLHGLVGKSDSRWQRAHHLWQEALFETGTWKRS